MSNSATMNHPERTQESPSNSVFPKTRWTLVCQASNPTSPEAQSALEEICRSYWKPLYFIARRKNLSPEDAEDLVQTMFVSILEYLKKADSERGKLRTLLCTVIHRRITDEYRKSQTAIRGSGARHIPIDCSSGESEYLQTPAADQLSSEEAFDYYWAVEMIHRCFAKVGEERKKCKKYQQFEAIKALLLEDGLGIPSEHSRESLASDWGVSRDTLKARIKVIKDRLVIHLAAEITETVDNPMAADGMASKSDIEQEIKKLFKAAQPNTKSSSPKPKSSKENE